MTPLEQGSWARRPPQAPSHRTPSTKGRTGEATHHPKAGAVLHKAPASVQTTCPPRVRPAGAGGPAEPQLRRSFPRRGAGHSPSPQRPAPRPPPAGGARGPRMGGGPQGPARGARRDPSGGGDPRGSWAFRLFAGRGRRRRALRGPVHGGTAAAAAEAAAAPGRERGELLPRSSFAARPFSLPKSGAHRVRWVPGCCPDARTAPTHRTRHFNLSSVTRYATLIPLFISSCSGSALTYSQSSGKLR